MIRMKDPYTAIHNDSHPDPTSTLQIPHINPQDQGENSHV